jgi:hypothetical protein
MKRAWLYNLSVRVREFGERHKLPWIIRLGIRLKWAANG